MENKEKRSKLPKPKGDFYSYIKCVYKDPEFLSLMKNVKALIASFEKENPGEVFTGVDAEYNPSNIRTAIKETCNEFEIHWDRVILFLDYPKNTPINIGGVSGSYDKEFGRIILEIDPQLSKKEFLGFWSMVRLLKKEARIKERQRGSDNPELAYAIYRARKKGMKFVEIKDALGEGELRNYSKKTKTVYTEDYVKKIYHNFQKGKDRGSA